MNKQISKGAGKAKINFNDYTKQFPLMKSIQLELVPTEQTSVTIKDLNLCEYDENIRNIAEQVEPYVDDAIRQVINQALSQIDFDFSTIELKDGKVVDQRQVNLLQRQIASAADKACKELFEIKDVKQISSAAFISYILSNNNAAELASLMKGKAEVMRSFLTSRITTVSTEVPNRVIDNYKLYAKNAAIFKKILDSAIGDDVRRVYPEMVYCTESSGYTRYLSQPDIDRYNDMVNGTVTESGIEVKGIINMVCEYNNDKFKKSLPKPNKLYKQMLMERKKAYAITALETDDDLKTQVKETAKIAKDSLNLVSNALKEAKPEDIVVCFNKLHSISNKVYGNNRTIPNTVLSYRLQDVMLEYESAEKKKDQVRLEKKMKKIEDTTRKEQFTFQYLEEIMADNTLFDVYKRHLNVAAKYALTTTESLLAQLDSMTDIRNTPAHVGSLKEYFNAWTDYRNYLSNILRSDIDSGSGRFYNCLDDEMPGLKTVARVETKVLAYVTRRPADVAIKQTTWLGAAARGSIEWIHEDGIVSRETGTIIFRDGKYYLFMLTSDAKPVCIAGDSAESKAFTQRALKKISQNLPRLTISSKAAKEHWEKNTGESYVITEGVSEPVEISRELYDLYMSKRYTKGVLNDKKAKLTEEEYRENLLRIIEMYMEYIRVSENFSFFDVKVKNLEEYSDIKEFYDDVEACTCKTTWIPVSDEMVDELVEKGHALMFLIRTRNLYTEKTRKTSYDTIFLTAMSEDPQGIMVRSNPKIYYREASITNPVVHKEGSIMVNRFDVDKKRIPEEVYTEIFRYYNSKMSFQTELSEAAQHYIATGKVVYFTAKYPIIKDNRYTQNKYILSLSITKNAETTGSDLFLNSRIARNMERSMPNILTITRTAQDLIYETIQDSEGNLLKSTSLNVINGFDYWAKLKKISDARKAEKSNAWKYDRQVKDIRNDYIQRAITEIVKDVLEYGAIVVCEFIREDIKNKYDALDNTVFKGFENALVSRLSDLHFKDIPAGEPGSISNPYQLCGENGNDYQNGIVFFVSPAYTANADMESGFINILDTHNIRTLTDKRYFISKFDAIKYDSASNRFIFKMDYDKFVKKEKTNLALKKWDIRAGGPAVYYNREYKFNEYIPEEASQTVAAITKKHDISDDFPSLALKGELSNDAVNALYTIFANAVCATINGHDGERRKYISPITGKESDYAEHANLVLAKKFLWTRMDDDSRNAWLDSIIK